MHKMLLNVIPSFSRVFFLFVENYSHMYFLSIGMQIISPRKTPQATYSNCNSFALLLHRVLSRSKQSNRGRLLEHTFRLDLSREPFSTSYSPRSAAFVIPFKASCNSSFFLGQGRKYFLQTRLFPLDLLPKRRAKLQ